MEAQEDLEQVAGQLTEVRKLKLRDIQLDQFSGTEKEWRTFKISLSCTLSDFDLEEVMDGSEAFPFPDDPQHPSPLICEDKTLDREGRPLSKDPAEILQRSCTGRCHGWSC
jgi:hypothetical protein